MGWVGYLTPIMGWGGTVSVSLHERHRHNFFLEWCFYMISLGLRTLLLAKKLGFTG